MKNLLKVLLLFSVLFSACTFTEKPEFLRIENLKANKVSLTNINITSDAVFFNPNDIGYEVVESNIDVFINDKLIGKAKQIETINIDRKGNFSLPLEINYSPQEILKDSKDLFSSILFNVLTQKIDLTFKGNIKLQKAGIPIEIPLEYKHTLKL